MAFAGVSSEGRGKAGEEEEEAENPDFTFRRTLKGNVRWLDAAGDNGPGGTGAKVRGRTDSSLRLRYCIGGILIESGVTS